MPDELRRAEPLFRVRSDQQRRQLRGMSTRVGTPQRLGDSIWGEEPTNSPHVSWCRFVGRMPIPEPILGVKCDRITAKGTWSGADSRPVVRKTYVNQLMSFL